MKQSNVWVASVLIWAVAGCADDSGPSDVDNDRGRYAFTDSKGADTVSYGGQVFRHVLIEELTSYIDELTSRIDSDGYVPEEGEVVDALNFYYRFDSVSSGSVELSIETDPATEQRTFDDLGSDKDLFGKLAGQDEVGQHKDWSNEFVGWQSATSPHALIEEMFEGIEAQAIARANGQDELDPTGGPLPSAFVTEQGLDLKQLVQKFLTGAIAYSQAADDYLDDDVEGKGLLSDNAELVEGDNYTELAHAWDEGFGYFGAARDYNDYTDEEVAGSGGRSTHASGYFDSDGNGAINLFSEFNFGHAVNAAKRDLGAHASTDFSAQAFDAFRVGRSIIAEAPGALSESVMAQLREQRDKAVTAWEQAISATVVHYINELLQDMAVFDTDDYNFANHAKHWSELKGFALCLQFNPRSMLTDEQFAELHDLIGDVPVLPNQTGAAAYRADLLGARALLAQAYSFDDANLGDDNGESGW